MKITRIEAVAVDVPYKKPFVINGGPSTVGDHVLTRVHTDEGIIGYGEGAPMVTYSEETQKDILNGVLDYLAPVVTGMDPHDMEEIHRRMNAALPGHQFAKASIDLALWDIMGKRANLPVYKLLGGHVRDWIPLAWVVGIGSIDEMVAEAVEHVQRYGFKTVKLKVGREPQKDLAVVREVRAALGQDVKIRVDANQGYDVSTAIKTLRRMEQYDLELIEQPVPAWNILGMAEVAAALDTPIEADESMFGYHDAMTLVRLKAADVINIKIMKPCGLYGSKKVAAVAEAAGLTCLIGSMVEFGPGTAAGLHFAAAHSVVTHACEQVGGFLFSDDVVEEDFSLSAVVEGALPVPQAPGLGITIREEYRG